MNTHWYYILQNSSNISRDTYSTTANDMPFLPAQQKTNLKKNKIIADPFNKPSKTKNAL